MLALHPAGVDQSPWAMADRRDRLLLGDEVTDEGDGLGLQPQGVGVHHPARQDEGVVGRRVGRGQLAVHRHGAALLLMLPALDLAGLGRDDLDGSAGGLQGLDGLFQFRLLEAVGGEHGDLAAGEGLSGHGGLQTG